MIQLRKNNQQMVQNLYFKTIEGQVMTQDQESALIKRNSIFTIITVDIFILIRDQYFLVKISTHVEEGNFEATCVSKSRRSCRKYKINPRDKSILFQILTHDGFNFLKQTKNSMWYKHK